MNTTDYLNTQLMRLNFGAEQYKICLQDEQGTTTNWISLDTITMQEVIRAMGATLNITSTIAKGYEPKPGEIVQIF